MSTIYNKFHEILKIMYTYTFRKKHFSSSIKFPHIIYALSIFVHNLLLQTKNGITYSGTVNIIAVDNKPQAKY